jgi:hypothetical protein
MEDFDRPDIAGDISAVLRKLNVSYAEADLVLDLGAPNFVPIGALVRIALALFEMVPVLNRWRTFTFAGTSYPQSIATVQRPFELVPRHEWSAYRALVSHLGSEMRIPAFGDYAVAHPDLVELDMRLIKPFAKLRYTVDDHWHIGRGMPVRTHGFGQYKELCGTLVARPYFSGAHYSAGDRYIVDCAAGSAPTGNLSTWVWVSTNRHITKVVADLATFHALSTAV